MEIFHGFVVANFLITIILLISTFVSFIRSLCIENQTTLPKQIPILCSCCQSNNFFVINRKEKFETKVNKEITGNLIISGILIFITIIIYFILFFESDDVFSYIFNLITIEEIDPAYLLDIAINQILTKIQSIILVINTVLYILWGHTQKNVLITVCKNCGTVTSHNNENP